MFYLHMCNTGVREVLLSRNRPDKLGNSMKSPVQQPNLKEDKISKIIDRVLIQIFGKEASTMIYKHLEHNYSVKKNEVGEKLELFAQGLENFLKSGAYVIERKILEDIWSSYDQVQKLQTEKPKREGSFATEVKVLLREA